MEPTLPATLDTTPEGPGDASVEDLVGPEARLDSSAPTPKAPRLRASWTRYAPQVHCTSTTLDEALDEMDISY